jgi:hypothetical protein
MLSKYILLATSVLLLASVPAASATVGTYLSPANVSTSGPLVDRVVFGVCADEASCSSLLTSGSIQAAELAFSIGAWTSLCPPPQGSGSTPSVICGATVSYTWVGLSFDYLKFPGDNENFRRAIQFMQDYSYIQSTVLQGVLGLATDQPTSCNAYPSACNPIPINTHYGTSQNLVAAGEELEMVTDGTPATTVFCDNGGVQCSGVYSSTSEWCVGALGTGSGCGSGTPFSPNLWTGKTLHRDLWSGSLVSWASNIGLVIDNHLHDITPPLASCFTYHTEEIISRGVYSPSTGYNSAPVYNSTVVANDPCDMLMYGFVASGPDLVGLMSEYNSQYEYPSVGNIHDGFTGTSPPDLVAGYPNPTPHVGIYNLDYTTNEAIYGSSLAQADGGARDFMNAYALQIPTVVGYYGNTLYADSANGWSGFAQEPVTGPNELGGLYYSLMNAHQCGPATCTLGAINGGTLGGTLVVGLQAIADVSGLNPLYPNNWPWQADVFGSIFDTPLISPPAQFNNEGYLVDHMTSNHSLTDFASLTTGTGPSWFYFQQPCTRPLPASTHAARLAACQGRSGPEQSPGAMQRGFGLAASARTLVAGQEITLTFRNDVYFSDGIQVRANDYLSSLYLFNVAGSPNLEDSASPLANTLSGPYGLIAAQMTNSHGQPCAIDCPTVNLYIGSQSIWSLGDVNVPVLPAHVWKYFNPDLACTAAFGCIDTTKWFGSGPIGAYSTGPRAQLNSWIWYSPNVEIGSGPFWLASWNAAAGTGEIDANPSYFDPSWLAEANVTSVSLPYTVSTTLTIPLYNPTPFNINCGPSAPGPIIPASSGMCQITNAMGGADRLKVYDGSGLLWRSLRLSKNSLTGVYSATIPAGLTTLRGRPCSVLSNNCFSMPSGRYYAVLKTTYLFHTQLRTWYQIFGFSLS